MWFKKFTSFVLLPDILGYLLSQGTWNIPQIGSNHLFSLGGSGNLEFDVHVTWLFAIL